MYRVRTLSPVIAGTRAKAEKHGHLAGIAQYPGWWILKLLGMKGTKATLSLIYPAGLENSSCYCSACAPRPSSEHLRVLSALPWPGISCAIRNTRLNLDVRTKVSLAL